MWLAPRWAAWLSPPNGLGTTKVLCSNGRQKAERVAVTFHWRTFFSVFRTMLLQLHNGKLNWIFSSLDFVSGFHTLSVNSVLPFAWILLKIFYCLLYTRMQWITRKYVENALLVFIISLVFSVCCGWANFLLTSRAVCVYNCRRQFWHKQ